MHSGKDLIIINICLKKQYNKTRKCKSTQINQSKSKNHALSNP